MTWSYVREDKFEPLYNKTVMNIEVAETKSTLFTNVSDLLRIIFEDGSIYYLVAEADCCSISYFENTKGNLIGSQIRMVTVSDTIDREATEKSLQECDQVTTYTFALNNGIYSIDLVNSSNGYYSGFVSVTNEMPKYYKLESEEVTFKIW